MFPEHFIELLYFLLNTKLKYFNVIICNLLYTTELYKCVFIRVKQT